MEMQTKEIDGTLYAVKPFNAIKGIGIQTKLIKVLGGSLGTIQNGGIEKALEILSNNIDDGDVEKLIISLFDTGIFTVVKAEGEPIKKIVDLDTHFIGEYARMWKVVLFILEVNFGDIVKKLTSNSNIREALNL